MITKHTFYQTSMSALVCGAYVLSSTNTIAEEFTLERGDLEQVLSVDAVAMPVDVLPIQISPTAWKSFVIKDYVAHGIVVKKGDPLLTIDTEEIDKKVEDLTEKISKQQLMLELAELKFSDEKSTNKEKLAKAELKFERFQEDYKRYRDEEKPVKLSDLKYAVTRAKNSLSYSQEELEQLMKMYEEDGLTEETEEIIVERVKHAMEAAKRNLKNVERREKHGVEVVIPREDADWVIKETKEKRELEYARKNLPLELQAKEKELSKMERDLAKAQDELTKVKADRDLMKIVSPADGIVYYGQFKDGKWSSEAASKAIKLGGNVPLNTTVMTVVPQDSGMAFNAFFSEKQKDQLGDAKSGSLRLETHAWKSAPVKVSSMSETPLLNQKWIVSLVPVEEMEEDIIVGSKAKISIVTANVSNVLSIPKKAVSVNADGTFTVDLKMAEGDPQKTEIKLGIEAGDKLEVLEGLENGQVIIISKPESK